MLLEMMNYTAKLIGSNSNVAMTSTIAGTIKATTAHLPSLFVTTNQINDVSISTNSYTKLDTLSSTVESTVDIALVKVIKTNLTDHVDKQTPPGAPTVSSTLAVDDFSAVSMQMPRQPPPSTFPTMIAGNKNRTPSIIFYPTVSPESIVIPIVSCIFGFPILALIVICCLRRRAKLARERDRRRNYDMQDHAVSLVRFSPIHRLNYRSSRAISLRPERSLSQGFTSLELDTVMEERSDAEQTQTEILNAESPLDSSSIKVSFTS